MERSDLVKMFDGDKESLEIFIEFIRQQMDVIIDKYATKYPGFEKQREVIENDVTSHVIDRAEKYIDKITDKNCHRYLKTIMFHYLFKGNKA